MAENRIGKDRMLELYTRLAEGKLIYKAEEAEHYKCSLRSIQRDIEDLRTFFHNQSDASGIVQDIIYDKKLKGYKLVPPLRNVLSNKEVFAVLKILLESRSLSKAELDPILDKLIDCCVPKECKGYVTNLISNERFHYVPPRHNKEVLDTMWRLGEALREHKEVEVQYRKPGDGSLVHRVLRPAGIMFSEFYFYLAGFIVPKQDDSFKEEQKSIFIKQILLANQYQKPIAIHMRSATKDTLDILKEYAQTKILFHCFSGSKETMMECLKLTSYISFAGPITFKNARQAPECIINCPVDHLLTETDSPYLSPVPFRGKQNEPKNVQYVVKKICELKQIEETVLCSQIEKNFYSFFNKD